MDGDMDYLFLLDGILYLKKSNTYQPNKILDTTIETQDIDSSLVPSAADFFHENISLSHIFSFSYDAPQLVDAMWRVEFYDQYIQWDMSQLDSGNNSTSPHIIELVDVEKLTKNKTLRVLRSIDTPSELVIEGPRMEILTGAMDFVVTPGRVLYAGDRSTTIFYSTGTDIPYVRKTLAPAEQISFSETTNVSLRS